MVAWYGMTFQSSFTNTGEFANRTGPVIQPIQKCDDCKTSSETFDKQRELLLNQDRQISQGYQIQKISKEQIKQMHTKLKVTEKQLAESLTKVVIFSLVFSSNICEFHSIYQKASIGVLQCRYLTTGYLSDFLYCTE